MKINRTECYEEAHVTLYRGKDFSKHKLEMINGMLKMPEVYGDEIARKYGYDHLYWTGVYNDHNHTVDVIFRKKIK